MANPENIIPPKPGEVRNPNGRPKGSRNRSTIAREWLEMEMQQNNPITKQKEKMQVQDAVTLALIGKALKGDVAAFRELMDSAYGKLINNLDVKSDGEKIQFDPFAQIRKNHGLDEETEAGNQPIDE